MALKDMMVTVTARVGDRMIIDIAQENLNWGYRPFAQGTEVEVVGFATRYRGRVGESGVEPGAYVNPQWIDVRDEHGRSESINASFLKATVGCEPYKTSVASLRIGDLPETYIWEWDIVRVPGGSDLKVLGIDYDYIGRKRADGRTPMPPYRCGENEGGYASYQEDQIVLVERGNIWKRAHGEAVVFKDVAEEASFHLAVGDYDEIRNPRTDTYAWELEELLDALAEGIAHGIRHSGFGSRPGAIRFHDEDAGERIRLETLRGFDRKPLLTIG